MSDMKKPKITGGREEDYEDYYDALEAWGDELQTELQKAKELITRLLNYATHEEERKEANELLTKKDHETN